MTAQWQTKRLADFAATVSTGPFGSVLHKSDYVDDGVPLVNPTNMIGEAIVPDSSKLIGARTKRRLSSYVLKNGDVVVARRGEIGRCAVVGPNEDGWVCGTGSFFVRPLPSLDSRFLAHLIRSSAYREQLERLSTGTTMRSLSNTALGNLAVSIPPLLEQRRIVAFLDEAFESIATSKVNAERNLENARSVFDGFVDSVLRNPRAKWGAKKLGDVAQSISTGPFGTMLHKKDYVVDGIPLVNPMNIVDSKIIPSSRMMVNAATRDRLSGYVLKSGDIVVARRGELGRCALVGDREAGWLCGTGSFFVRLSNVMDGAFLVTLLSSGPFKRRLEASSVGTTMSSLNNSILSDLVVPVPPLAEQRTFMKNADALLAEGNRLSSVYHRKLAALDELKKSLLHQAFTGQL